MKANTRGWKISNSGTLFPLQFWCSVTTRTLGAMTHGAPFEISQFFNYQSFLVRYFLRRRLFLRPPYEAESLEYEAPISQSQLPKLATESPANPSITIPRNHPGESIAVNSNFSVSVVDHFPSNDYTAPSTGKIEPCESLSRTLRSRSSSGFTNFRASLTGSRSIYHFSKNLF